MKKFLSLALVAMFASSSFAADISLKNFKLYGEGSVMAMTYENVWAANLARNFGATVGYFTLGTLFSVYENVTASFALGYEYMWGEDGLYGKTVDGDANQNVGYLNRLRAVEANINFSQLFNIDGLSAKIGRQYYGDEDSTAMYIGIRRNQPLFVKRNYQPPFSMNMSAITSADGAVAYYDNHNIKANLMYGVLTSNFSNPMPGTTVRNFTVLGGDFKYLGIIDMFDIQAYMYNFENGDGSYQTYNTPNYTLVGVKPTFKFEGLKASVEFIRPFAGKTTFDDRFMAPTNLIKGDVSYTIKNINLTPRAMYLVAGGDGKSFYTMGNYSPGLIVGNTMLNSRWNNNQIINIGVDYAWNKALFKLDYFNFDAREGKNDLIKAPFKYGDEIDLVVNYAYTDSVSIYAGIGHLFGNSKSRNPNYDSSTLQAGVTYKFK